MERVFLYYPTIDIPNKEWLYNVILYTDKVSSILPNREENHLPDTLKFLTDKGLYKPIYINDILHNYPTEFQRFEKKFIEAIDDKRFFFRSSATPRDTRFQGIYNDKMTNSILRELDKRNLITQGTDRVFMPENAAIYYMNILAQFIAEVNISSDIIIPSTDYKRFSDLTFGNPSSNKEAVNIVFDNCLPMPDINTPISKIVDFKLSHRDELLRFRQFINDINMNISNARDRSDINEILILTKEKIELELNVLNKVYNRNKIKTILTTMDSLLSLDNPDLFKSLVAVGLLSTTLNPVVGIGIAGFAVGVKLIDSYLENKDKLKTNELNYLFEARKARIIK